MINNDIDCVCDSNSILKMFADDLKIYSIFDLSHVCNSMSNYLQKTINKVCEWAAKWQFTINVRN